ncbi:hypothetical protein EniLVp02_0243 [Vibrio phage EniLVp02]
MENPLVEKIAEILFRHDPAGTMCQEVGDKYEYYAVSVDIAEADDPKREAQQILSDYFGFEIDGDDMDAAMVEIGDIELEEVPEGYVDEDEWIAPDWDPEEDQ